ncbi:DUF5715 family protein [Niabella ginsengisoli]|uniref:DUF5715 family protein n=1 Tax=Niabella ginsengisoli TaxID=522298 RepID=A0ABS9SNM2_9BACT|nr:DUF5715 family protein [Niabella ginsengisoli]MCH5599945.1 DUF5715 family protein [Niabella ginsengisoli]
MIKYLLVLTYLFFGGFCSFGQTKYDVHLEAAKRTGIPPIKNQAHVTSLVSKKKLVVVFAKTGYTIAKLTHSRPYVTPKSYRILKEIGVNFYKQSKKKTFTVTSITRTLYDQKRLARVNSNAVTSKLSSHNFGCSFDISYIRFNRRKAPNARLEKTLQSVLTQMQRQGKLYFIKEYREKCFHVTIR